MNPAIELFRGVAALMVLTSHYETFLVPEKSLLHYLSTGVDFFFVISGFVFGQTIFSKKNPAVIPFFIRRFFRIYPLYAFSLIFYYLFSRPDPNRLIYLFKHLLFLQTTASPQEAVFFNGAYWTLPAEIEFYMAVPFLAILYSRYKRLLPALLFCGVAANVFLVHTAPLPPAINAYSLSLFHLPGVLTEFVIGMLLFRVYDHRKDAPLGLPVYLGIFFSGVFIILMLGFYLVKTGYQNTDMIAIRLTNFFFCTSCAIGYALILFPFLHKIRSNESTFTRFCLYSGTASYGIYLFHSLTPQLLEKSHLLPSGPAAYVICTLITVGASIGLHYTIEAPLRSFGRELSKKLAKITVP